MKLLLTLAGAITALLSSKSALAEYGLNMTQGITDISKDIYGLHMMVFWVCVAIGVVVFGAMFYSIIAHRKSKGAKASHFHENTAVEFLWTGIPIIILIAMAIPASKTLIDIEVLDKADMTVKVTGMQWKWQYDYPDEEISFVSNLAQSSRDVIYSTPEEREAVNNDDTYLLSVDKHLVLPVDTTIRFLITSSDVIHNWWVPAFAVKQDANPGFINDAWARPTEIGTYRGQCAELCGKDHGFIQLLLMLFLRLTMLRGSKACRQKRSLRLQALPRFGLKMIWLLKVKLSITQTVLVVTKKTALEFLVSSLQ
jgi:cytochrome c oxidase subunit 2